MKNTVNNENSTIFKHSLHEIGEFVKFKKGPFGSSLKKSMFVSESSTTYKVYEQQHAIKKDHTRGKYYITKNDFKKLNGFQVVKQK